MAEVLAVAAERDAVAVTDVYVSVGPLSGVEGPLLCSAFPFAAAGTIASRAVLHLQPQAVRVRCGDCGADTEAAPNRLVCARCDSWRTQLQSGDELLLQRVLLNTDRQEGKRNV